MVVGNISRTRGVEMSLKQFFEQFGFEPKINNGVLWKLKKRSVFTNLYFGISRLCGRIPFEMFKKQFYPQLGSRVVEMPFVFTNLPKGKLKILDFGCNESALPIQLASLGHEVRGYDLQDYEYKHKNFKFCKGNILDNEFPKESFDVITAISVVEHVGIGSYDSPKFSDGDIIVMKELKRLLKKDGILILTVPIGVRHKDELQRIYDAEALEELISEFKVKEAKYFSRNPQMTEWSETTLDNAEQIQYDKIRESDAIACLVLTK